MGVPEPMEFDDPLDGHMTAAGRPEAIGIVVKNPLEERIQELPKHFLSHTVADRRDTQRPCLAVALGDMDATQGQGLEGPILEASHQGQQVLQEIVLEESDADLVNPRRTAIAFHVAEGSEHDSRGDTPGQRMRFDLGHSRRSFLLNSMKRLTTDSIAAAVEDVYSPLFLAE